MTLIDYLNRVHFAENVLEEAVWAELDTRREQPICLITDDDHIQGDLNDRLRGALPRSARSFTCTVRGMVPLEFEALRIAEAFTAGDGGVLLAYGPGAVINTAKAVRLLVGHGPPLARFSDSEGGALRITGSMPDLIAVPTLRGFTTGFNGLMSVLLDQGAMIDVASRALVPTVTIADPTIASREPPDVRASAGVSAIALCVEALLSPNYNPPASGIALDGLSRGLRSLKPAVADNGLNTRRELMAACMNAAMVQQKGLGLAHAMASALCAVLRDAQDTCGPDKGAIKRLILPGIAAFHTRAAPDACEALARALGLEDVREIAPRLAAAFEGLPLPTGLGDMGLTPALIDDAATLAARHRALANGPCRPRASDIHDIYRAVF